MYLLAYAVTIIFEVPIVMAIFWEERWKMGLVCFLATSTTHMVMHFLLPFATPSLDVWLISGEMLALLFEAAVYALFSKPRSVSKALIASSLANTASFSIGLLLF